MKIKYYILIISILFSNILIAQNWSWVAKGEIDINADIRGSAIDSFDNVYIYGQYADTITIGTETLNPYGGEDIFLAKFDKNGVFKWAARAGSTGNEGPFGICIDIDQNIYITGGARSICIFDDADTTKNIISIGGQDVFLAKYNSSGNVIWTKNIGECSSGTRGYDIMVDGVNLIITGMFKTDITIGETTDPGKISFVLGGARDYFVAQFDTSGAINWAKQYSSTSINTNFISLANHIGVGYYVSGVLYDDITIGATTYTSSGNSDIFTMKLDNNGDTLWVSIDGGINDDQAKSISVDELGNIYTSGYAQGTSYFGNGDTSIISNSTLFISKYNSDGNFQWVKSCLSNGISSANGIVYDNNNLFITGYYKDTLTIGSDTLRHPFPGFLKPFIAQYNDNGNGISAAAINGDALDDEGKKIIIDSEGIPYIFGTYNSTTLDFGNGLILTNADAATNVFIAKYWNQQLVATNATCGCNGSVVSNILGGVAPISYLWSNSETTDTISNLCADTYIVTATDFNGIELVDSITITQAPNLTSSIGVIDNDEYGGEIGVINLTISGGTSPYNTLWSNDSTTENLSNLSAGWYYVTITDFNGCTKLDTAEITQPDEIVLTLIPTNISCFGGSNGAIDLSVVGGITPYTYLWSNDSTTEDISGLTTGWYKVTVTDSLSISKIDSVEITSPQILSASYTSIIPTCYGDSDGSINLTVSGGATPYTYLWSNDSTTEDISGVVADVYYVTITDDSLCQLIDTTLLQNPQQISLLLEASSANCYDSLDGSINLSVVSGKWPYTFAWDNLETTEDLSNVGAGNYTVTVTDYDGCQKTGTSTVTNPQQLNQVLNVSSPACYGGADGTIDLTVYGGTPNYTFIWSNAETTQNLTNLSSGQQIVTITDNNGCESVDSVTVNDPAEIVLSFSQSNISCFGKNDGEIILMVNNGTAPYTYAWSNLETTKDISGLAAGTYTVTVTDIGGCSVIDSTTITEPADISITEIITNSDCANDNIGAIDITTTGGTSPYAYFWSDNSTSEDLSALDGGSYYLTVNDNNNCIKTASYTITEPNVLLATFIDTSVSCFGGNDGAIGMTVSGGTVGLDYTYSWSEGETTQNISGQIAGTYTVDITDDNGCSLTDSSTITEPSVLTVMVTSDNVSCNGGSDGTASLSVSGGTSPYLYAWTGGETTASVTGLIAGTHYVTITDINSCQLIDSAVISEPVVLSIFSSVTNISCYGNADGEIDITVSDGTSPYTYNWNNASILEDLTGLNPNNYYVTVTDDNDCQITSAIVVTEPIALSTSLIATDASCNGDIDGAIDMTLSGGTTPYNITWSNLETSEDISGLGADTYTVNILDANLCEISDSATVLEPSILSVIVSQTDITCFGFDDGTASLVIAGGTTPYTYAWTDGQTTQNTTNLTAGTHYVTITDANLCQLIDNVIINEPTQLDLTITISDVTCSDFNDGDIDITVSGGISPYTYAWSNLEITEDITTLIADDYTVTITDVNNCTFDSIFTVSEPLELYATFVDTSVSCFGGNDGAVDMTVLGGTTPYNITWSNLETSEDITSLIADTYTVNILDANSCSFTDSVTITEPDVLAFILTETDITCFGYADGTANLSVAGGTYPYTFAWSNGATNDSLNSLDAGTYYFTITDSNLCEITDSATILEPNEILLSVLTDDVNCYNGTDGNIDINITNGITPLTYLWSNDSTSEDLVNIIAGNYTVTVTDFDGCMNDTNITISQPTELAVSLIGTNVNCNGGADGSIDASVSGGTTPYAYLWSNLETSEDITSLIASTYTLTVTDSLACTTIETVEITEPIAPSITLSATNADCGQANGSTWIESYTGFTEPTSILWSTGEITDTAQNLIAGVYQVIITDVNGCSDSTAVIINNTTGPVTDSLIITNVTCYGGYNGSSEILISGGTSPYTYAWSNSEITSSISNLSAGGYDVTVTDANSCQLIETITITQPEESIISYTTTDVTCYGGNNGDLTINISYGETPYTYIWDNGETTNSLNNLIAGTYNVTISDNNACETLGSAIISEPSQMLITTNSHNSNCGMLDGSALITSITNVTLPYSSLWNTGETTDSIASLTSGTYQVIITGADGCIDSTSVNISDNGAPTIIDTITNVTCYGFADGEIDLTISGGTTPYSIVWSNTENTEDLTGLLAGDYTITLIDASACQAIKMITVIESDDLIFNFTTTDNVCYGESNGAINLIVSGGTSPYTYLWDNTEITSDISNLISNDYSITVTDSLACTYSNSVTVVEPEMLSSVLTYADTLCYGASTNITTVVSGGTYPYTYLWSVAITESSLSNVTAGSYYLTITDNVSCTHIDTANISENDSIFITETITDLICNGDESGAINIIVSGGFTPHTYTWSNDTTIQNISQLDAGTYTVTASDNAGCSAIGTYTVSEPTAFALNDSVNNVMCYGDETGSIFINLTGGTPPYSYLWSDGATITDTLVNIDAGDYTITVIDSLYCMHTEFYTITQPEFPMIVTSEVIQNSCYQDGIGAIDITIFGGVTPYSYLWSDSTTTSKLTGLYEGEYSVIFSDINACTDSLDFSIIASEPLVATYQTTSATCSETEDGQIFISITNGASPYNFDWSNGEISQNLANIISGNYNLTVTDANNCTDTLTIIVDNNSLSCIEIYNAFSPNGDGVNEVWNIKGIENYPSCKVNIYNQWGKNVFSSDGYATPWDGIGANGKALPSDSYFYVIDIGNGDKPYQGSISLIK